MRQLDVYLGVDLVGRLVQDDHGDVSFQYTDGWMQAEHAVPLSQSLPLRPGRYSRRECAAFFNNLLPEGTQREVIARTLGISARNDFAMLAAIGGECAGAVAFMPPGAEVPIHDGCYQALGEADLADVLRGLPRRPLMAGNEGVRLSLAGAQGKLPVHFSAGQVSLPLRGAPSTHILKPASADFAGIVANEMTCMRLAKDIGLPVAGVQIGRTGDLEYLIVERYDRVQDERMVWQRLHQEDLCQAMGVVSDRKYQAEGGPGTAQSVELLRAACTAPARDLLRFVDGVIFNYLIGNCDAHGKNYSILYRGGTRGTRVTELAPLYDLVCTVAYPGLSTRMAMSIGGGYSLDKIGPQHFARMAAEAGIGRPGLLRRVVQLARLAYERVSIGHSDGNAPSPVVELIRERCARVLATFES